MNHGPKRLWLGRSTSASRRRHHRTDGWAIGIGPHRPLRVRADSSKLGANHLRSQSAGFLTRKLNGFAPGAFFGELDLARSAPFWAAPSHGAASSGPPIRAPRPRPSAWRIGLRHLTRLPRILYST